ncbi:MAG: DUF2163 domain-containing protein [Sphingomonas sp.]|nr:DUF2163 domain-containing protein [Sphingomonas sp.]
MSIADGELTSMALCWRLERPDGAGIALTSHELPVISAGTRFDPNPGVVPAAITRSLGLEPDAGELTGALSSDGLDDRDLALGRWDGSTMVLTAVDWNNPAAEPVSLLAGELGSVGIDGKSFTADLHGAAARLEGPVCPATSAECRASFGDKQCRVDLAGRTIAAKVVTSSDGALTLDREVDDRFVLGRLRYMSGANCGRTSHIIFVVGDTIRIRDLPRGVVEPGSRIELREGCDKRFATCVSRFDNAANFRGEPHLPGNDLLTRYPGA